jgi:SAM-dependent methyltransferase
MKYTSQFDKIAVSYYKSIPEIPQSYITLLKETFNIKQTDRIIDLGCGSGNLTLALAEKSSFVQGVDASGVMLALAKKKDKDKKVTWTHRAVEELDLRVDRYNVIIAFEAFHLFSNKQQLIQRCARALKQGGVLSIGWALYEWEASLNKIIENTFAKYGSPLYEWGNWSCPAFVQDIKTGLEGFTPVSQKEIRIQSCTPVDLIIEFLFNISFSQTYTLHAEQKFQIIKELKRQFLQVYPSGVSEGDSKYIIAYSRKPL